MQIVDWVLTGIPLVCVLWVAVYTRRYVRSVADFLAGGRCAGRYLIANAYGESAAGVANTMSKFEIIIVSGFTVTFWNTLTAPVLLLVAVSGFVVYRYRETRALTLAQFFEMRYGRRFRLLMGCLAFAAGVLNYGIFPAVNSRFFVYFMGLPEYLPGGVPTFAVVMAAYLACVLAMLMAGGQVTLMVTDCVEGLWSLVILLVVMVAVTAAVGWGPVVETLGHQVAGRSMIDPFDASEVADFNRAYVVMALVLSIYGTMALQNTQGFNAAARSAHESRMAGILGKWRLDVRVMMLLAVTVGAVTFLRHPSFAVQSRQADALLAGMRDPQLRKQMTVAASLRYLLPVGVKGLFCSTMVMGLLAGDCSHVHSWGSIFVQDVLLPLRRRPVGTREHLWMLRLSMIGVVAFAFVFSLLFTQTHYIALWWQVTNAIFISGAGAAIIGGLYWRRGTAAGAWTAVIVGAVLSFMGILLNQYWPTMVSRWGSGGWPSQFPLNGIKVAFVAAGASSVAYVIVSLLTGRKPFDLEKMLHRSGGREKRLDVSWVTRVFGFDSHFTRKDRWTAVLVVGWSVVLGAVTAGVVVWNVVGTRWPLAWWGRYWMVFGVALPFVTGLVTVVWFGVGGVRDIRAFFVALGSIKRDPSDNGQVADESISRTK